MQRRRCESPRGGSIIAFENERTPLSFFAGDGSSDFHAATMPALHVNLYHRFDVSPNDVLKVPRAALKMSRFPLPDESIFLIVPHPAHGLLFLATERRDWVSRE